MKRLSWIITLPLLVVAVIFSVANRQLITFDIWPTEYSIAVPAFLPVLIALFLGFLAGGFIAWWSAGRARQRARDLQRDLEHQRFETARLKRELEKQSKAHAEALENAGAQNSLPAAPSSALPVTRADA